MASKVIVEMVDDLDGGAADETVAFAVDGRAFEIDLSEKNATKLRKGLAKYINSARRVRRVSPIRRSANGSGASNGDVAEIRAWAVENGYQVSSRGRIAAEIREAYQAR